MTRWARLFTPWGAAVVAGGLLVQGSPALAAPEQPVNWLDLGAVVHSDGPAVVRAPTAALLLSGQEGGALPLVVLASLGPGAGPISELTLQIELDGRSLLADEARRTVDLDLFVYALDPAGHVAAANSQRLSIDLDAWRQPLQQGGLLLLARLALPAGEYRLRALVRDPGLETFGIASLPVVVPAAGSSAMSGWLLEPRDEWLVALPAGDAPLVTQPVKIDAIHYLPAALPVWSEEAVSLAVFSTPTAGNHPLIRAHLESLDGTATAVLEIVTTRLRFSQDDRNNHVVEIRLPDLPSGRYDLVAAAGDNVVLRQSVLVWHQSADQRVSWTDLPEDLEMAAAQPPRPQNDTPEPTTTGTRVDLSALATGYRAALNDFADGDIDGAATSLRALEASADQTGYETLRWLEKTQRSAAARLSARSPEKLPSMFLLHVGQIEYYRQLRRGRLGEHSVRVAGRVAAEMRAQATDQDSTETAALATALLGEILRQSSRMRGSETLFRQALELDPTVTIALVGLAVAAEQTGRYDEAVSTLTRLVEVDPDNLEARLRLAVNLRRVDRPEDAAAQLKALLAADAPSWIHSIAAQESARIALESGDESGALAELRAAAARWADDQNIAVFIAYLLDRRNASHQARQTVERLAAAAPSARPSARHRYTLSPPAELQMIRTLLAERAGIARPARDSASTPEGGSR